MMGQRHHHGRVKARPLRWSVSVCLVLNLTVQTFMAGGENIEHGRTGVSPEISSLSDKDNGSDLGPSPGFATLRRLSLLTSVETAMTAASDSPAKGEICSGLQDIVRTWADVTMEMGNERLWPWLCL